MLKNERAQEDETQRERNKRLKLERIERAARGLFAERGYDQTTTREIAKAAEIGVGTLFVYFPEKVDLLIELFRKDLKRNVVDRLDEMPEGLSVVGACLHVFEGAFDFYSRDENLSRAFIKEMMFLRPEQQSRMFSLTVQLIRRLGEIVENAKARGEVREDVPSLLAGHQVFGIFYWCVSSWLSGVLTRQAATTQLRMSLELLYEGLKGESNDR